MNLATLFPLVMLGLALFLAFWMVFKKDLPSKGLLHVVWYLVGVLLIFFFALWMFSSVLPSWTNTTLQNLVVNQDVNQFQDTTRRILDTSFAGGPRLGTPSAPQTVKDTSASIAPAQAPAGSGSAASSPSSPLPTATAATSNAVARPQMSSAGAGEYVVQPGDSLAVIARKLGVSVNSLQSANSLYNPDVIYPGQRLRVPQTTP